MPDAKSLLPGRAFRSEHAQLRPEPHSIASHGPDPMDPLQTTRMRNGVLYEAEWPCCHDPLRLSLGSEDPYQTHTPSHKAVGRATLPLAGVGRSRGPPVPRRRARAGAPPSALSSRGACVSAHNPQQNHLRVLSRVRVFLFVAVRCVACVPVRRLGARITPCFTSDHHTHSREARRAAPADPALPGTLLIPSLRHSHHTPLHPHLRLTQRIYTPVLIASPCVACVPIGRLAPMPQLHTLDPITYPPAKSRGPLTRCSFMFTQSRRSHHTQIHPLLFLLCFLVSWSF